MMKASDFPFFSADLQKMMTEFKMPGFDMEAMMSAQRRNIEAITAANQRAVEGLQAVMRRQLEMLRQSMEEASSMTREITAEGAPEGKVARQTDLVRTAFERALSNMRELSEMVARSNNDAAEVISQRVTASLEELKDAVQKSRQ